jgi:hypothetical protein
MDTGKKRASETHCANGHPWTPQTTRYQPGGKPGKRGSRGGTYRICLVCRREGERMLSAGGIGRRREQQEAEDARWRELDAALMARLRASI